MLKHGQVFIGNYNQDLMDNGNLYEVQPDSSYSLFEVVYDN